MRSAAAREAILAATARQFQLRGYDNLTIEGIAKEAGVGKQTIYRWWPSRGALIAECLTDGRLFPVDFDIPVSGPVVDDVESWLDRVLAVLHSPGGSGLLRSLVAAAAEDDAVGQHLSEGIGVEQSLHTRLTLAVRAGELPADAPVDQLGSAILGAIIVQALGREEADAEGLRSLVRFLLRADGLAGTGGQARAPESGVQ